MTLKQLFNYITRMGKPKAPVIIPQRLLWDRISEERLQTLDARIKHNVRRFINEAEDHGILLRITWAYRPPEEQARLYAQGRTTPGPIVTWVKPGRSLHQHRLAFDVVEMVNGQPVWENPNWAKIGEMGEKYGFQWGGRWKKLDMPHFERRDLLLRV